jgi:hypothetical protein
MGTLTDGLTDPDTGVPYPLSTAYKLLSVYRHSCEHTAPVILLYRCTRPIADPAVRVPVRHLRACAGQRALESALFGLRGKSWGG